MEGSNFTLNCEEESAEKSGVESLFGFISGCLEPIVARPLSTQKANNIDVLFVMILLSEKMKLVSSKLVVSFNLLMQEMVKRLSQNRFCGSS